MECGQEFICGLEPFITVFQAEVRAILECVKALLVDDVRNHPIVICSDIQAALMALDSFFVTSNEFLKCKELLKELAVNYLVNILWVLGDSDIST